MRYSSKSNIRLTSHGMQRVKERTPYSVKNEILNFVAQARYYGIKIDLLNKENYKNFNLPWDLYKYVKNNCYAHSSDRLFLFRDYIFCFTGNKDKTLKTMFKIPEEFKGWWKNG